MSRIRLGSVLSETLVVTWAKFQSEEFRVKNTGCVTILAGQCPGRDSCSYLGRMPSNNRDIVSDIEK